MTQPFIGMYFIRENNDGNSYITGRVVARVEEHVYLLEPDNLTRMPVAPPFELMGTGEMCHVDEHGIPKMQLFPTREHMQAWIDWIDTPSEPRVLSIVKIIEKSEMDNLKARMNEAHADLKEAGHVPAIRPVE